MEPGMARRIPQAARKACELPHTATFLWVARPRLVCSAHLCISSQQRLILVEGQGNVRESLSS